MKIATLNINNVNKLLAPLLRWLQETSPDVVCKELKWDQAAARIDSSTRPANHPPRSLAPSEC
jgi:exonuclease III